MPRRSLLRLCWLLAVAACTHDIGAPTSSNTPAPGPMIVSNATTTGLALASVRKSSATALSYSGSVTAAADQIAYVSLLPNSAPGGTGAVIKNLRTLTTVTAPMVDGGLDPVPIPAATGDTIHIDVITAGGGTGPSFNLSVPGSRTPTVIRSSPARGKTGVPLNKSIVVVFSEPVSASSLSSSTIQLLRGSTPVSGSAKILEGVTASVVFDATSSLEPNTEYQLVLTRGVRDLDGQPLDSTVTIPFTTGTTTEGPVVNLTLVPDAAEVRVGDQFQLLVTATDAQGNVVTGKPITWSGYQYDDGPAVVTFTSTGLVTARNEGTAFILAQVDNALVAIMIDVSNTLNAGERVNISPDTLTIPVNDAADLTAETRDRDGNLLRLRVLHWSSTNSAIATVTPVADTRARVQGIAPGVAMIIGTVDGVSDTTVVSVGPIPAAAGLVLVPAADSMLVRQVKQLSAMSRNLAGGRAPLAATDVQWESSNTAVITIDASGNVTGVGAGTATITARWNGFTASTRLVVTQIVFQSLSAGKTHTCGVVTSGVAYCWGAGAFGQIGRPELIDAPHAPAGGPAYPWPMSANSPLTFSDVTVGGYRSCGITTASAAYCWGYNGDGALGNGTLAGGWRATPVLGNLAFTQIEAGTNHTCGVTTSQLAYCWGSNQAGQLGSNLGKSSSAPVPVQGSLSFTTVTAGGAHTCGLTTDGAAYCWGSNAAGQLGVGDNIVSSAVPLPVASGLTFASISAGESHTCALTRDASLYCWGWNLEGELGNGSAPTPSPTPILVAAGHTYLAVSAGGNHTCAIDTSHELYCWGLNTNGQLGLGPGMASEVSTPQRVIGGLAFAKLSLGSAHSCAATGSGIWYCWGKNDSGQLGVGNVLVDSPVPLEVLGQP